MKIFGLVIVKGYYDKFRWIPYRLTLDTNPAVYRWLWFNIATKETVRIK